MEILYIAPSIPNNFSRVRTMNLLKSFKANGCKVTVVALCIDKRELEYLKDFSDDIIVVRGSKFISYINCFISLFLPIPLQNAYVYSFKLHRLLSKLSKEKYDLVYIKRLRMAGYAKHFNKDRVFIDLTDSLTKYYDRVRKYSKGIAKIVNTEEYFKHLKYEIEIVRKYNTVICSSNDKLYLEKKHNVKLDNMRVIYNTIDTSVWYNKDIKSKKNRKKIVFSGVMDYMPNILAAEFIINEIMPKLPLDYSITFVGKNVPLELKKYESSRIHFTGFVKNMKKELEKYDIYLCPILAGSGVKNKILQASLVGLPIIVNHLGIEGIKEGFENYVFLAENADDFVCKINYLNSIDVSSKIKGGQDFIRKFYDYKNCTKDLIK